MPVLPRLEAVFFRAKGGGEPVREWLRALPKEQRRTIGEDIAYVQFKWPIGKPRVDHLRGAAHQTRGADIELALKRFKEWQRGEA